MKQKILLLIASVFMLSSCATMKKWGDDTPNEHYRITVTSNTPGLPVEVDGVVRGNTPYTFYSNKAKAKVITVKNGDEYQTLETKRRTRGATYWNFAPLYTFIWGFIVDYGTHNNRIYKQHDYHFDL